MAMEGLLLHLLQTGSSEPRFWKLFGSLRQDFDRLYWCFLYQPWGGAPDDFDEDSVLIPFQEKEITSVQLWKPGALSRYGDKFLEEFIEFWAIEPTRDDPKKLATDFENTPWQNQSKFIDEHASIWLIYTDSTSWEIFARKSCLIERLQDALFNLPNVALYKSQSDQRGRAFGVAGLSEVWKALHGK